MSINGNLDEVVVIDTNELDWTPSPSGAVLRKRLHLVGPEESGQVTGLVQFQPGANFPAHEHPDGEEFFVLDGVFSDDSGDYGPGSYLLNPEGFAHGPSSEEGCTIFVKLWQFDLADRTPVRRQTRAAAFGTDPEREGVCTSSLFEDSREMVSLETWRANQRLALDSQGGMEILVLDGGFIESGESFTRQSWLRLPDGSSVDAIAGEAGATVWIKRGHLAGPQTAPHISGDDADQRAVTVARPADAVGFR